MDFISRKGVVSNVQWANFICVIHCHRWLISQIYLLFSLLYHPVSLAFCQSGNNTNVDTKGQAKAVSDRCLSHSAFLIYVFFICDFKSCCYFWFLTPKGKFLRQHSILQSFYSEGAQSQAGREPLLWRGGAHRQTDSCREGERATASVTVWLLRALYMLLTPGRAALRHSLLSCRGISELLHTKTTTLKVKLFFYVDWQLFLNQANFSRADRMMGKWINLLFELLTFKFLTLREETCCVSVVFWVVCLLFILFIYVSEKALESVIKFELGSKGRKTKTNDWGRIRTIFFPFSWFTSLAC